MRLVVSICVLLGLGCATTRPSVATLKESIENFNDHLRWKRFSQAAGYLLPGEKADFLARYLEFEDDLSVENINIRDVSMLAGVSVPTAVVTVTAESYLLPSTVLEKQVITQRWEHIDKTWRVVERSAELVPEPVPELDANDPTEPPNP